MRTLSVALVVAALMAGLPGPARAEDLTIVSSVTTPRGMTRTQTQYLSPSRVRLSGEERDTIVDLTSGRITILDNRHKEYSETTLDELQAFLGQIDSAMAGRSVFDRSIGATASVTVEKGTGGKKIAGYDTDQYILTLGDSMRMDVWTTTALEPPARYFDARKVVYASQGPMARRFDRCLRRDEEDQGIPARQHRRLPDAGVAAAGLDGSDRGPQGTHPGIRVRRAFRLQEGGVAFRGKPAAGPASLALKPLVTTDWLAAELGAPDLRVADVRWYLDPARRGRDAYQAGHIPGAVFLDMDVDLSAPGGGRGLPLRPPSLAREGPGRARPERGGHRTGGACRGLRRPGRRHGGAAVVPPPRLRARRGGGARRRPAEVDGGRTRARNEVRHPTRGVLHRASARGMGPRQGGDGARGPAVARPGRAGGERYRGESDPSIRGRGTYRGRAMRRTRTISPAMPSPYSARQRSCARDTRHSGRIAQSRSCIAAPE